MNCPKCIDSLAEYIDNELSVRERHEVEAHLILCPECKTILREVQAVNSNFQEAVNFIPVPPGLEDKILASIQAEQVKARKQVVLTGSILVLLGSPVLLLFSSVFSAFVHWLYFLQSALWHATSALVQVISPYTSIGIGIATVFLIAIGTFTIKLLLRDIQTKEVFS